MNELLAEQIRLGNRIVVVIDPGKAGAIAYITHQGRHRVRKCPETQQEMWQVIQNVKAVGRLFNMPVVAFIEHQQPGAFGQGGERCSVCNAPKIRISAKASWAFSGNYHSWLAFLTAADIPTHEITPKKWMAMVGNLPSGKGTKDARKKELKRRAQQLYPSERATLWNADALMMLSVLKYEPV